MISASTKTISSLLLTSALVTLGWDSVHELLEIRNMATGVTEQRLYQESGECDDDRRRLAVLPGLNRSFALSDCIREVWLPWEPGIDSTYKSEGYPRAPWFGVSPGR